MTHAHNHDHHAVHVHSSGRVDPTATKTLRTQFASQYSKRFRHVKGLVWRGVAEDDRLALATQQTDDLSDVEINPVHPDPDVDPVTGGTVPTGVPPTSDVPEGSPPPDSGGVTNPVAPRDDEIIANFIDWFDSTQNHVVRGSEPIGEGNFADIYIEKAYAKGVSDANRRLVTDGGVPIDIIEDFDRQIARATFDVPVHARMIRLMHARHAAGVDGVIEANSREVRRILTQGLVEGWNPNRMGREINDRIDAIGITRAKTHSRTVIVGTYNEAALTRYEQMFGPDADVTAKVEWTTAGDNRVCPICIGLEGRHFTISKARGMLPAHPNCRCAWSPVPVSATGDGEALRELFDHGTPRASDLT